MPYKKKTSTAGTKKVKVPVKYLTDGQKEHHPTGHVPYKYLTVAQKAHHHKGGR